MTEQSFFFELYWPFASSVGGKEIKYKAKDESDLFEKLISNGYANVGDFPLSVAPDPTKLRVGPGTIIIQGKHLKNDTDLDIIVNANPSATLDQVHYLIGRVDIRGLTNNQADDYGGSIVLITLTPGDTIYIPIKDLDGAGIYEEVIGTYTMPPSGTLVQVDGIDRIENMSNVGALGNLLFGALQAKGNYNTLVELIPDLALANLIMPIGTIVAREDVQANGGFSFGTWIVLTMTAGYTLVSSSSGGLGTTTGDNKSHNHTGSTGSSGSHFHTTMRVADTDTGMTGTNGQTVVSGTSKVVSQSSSSPSFNLANTSNTGSHTHSVSINSSGGTNNLAAGVNVVYYKRTA